MKKLLGAETLNKQNERFNQTALMSAAPAMDGTILRQN